MQRPRILSTVPLDQLVANLNTQGLACLDADELCRVEGGRTRLAIPREEDLLRLNAGEVRVEVRPY